MRWCRKAQPEAQSTPWLLTLESGVERVTAWDRCRLLIHYHLGKGVVRVQEPQLPLLGSAVCMTGLFWRNFVSFGVSPTRRDCISRLPLATSFPSSQITTGLGSSQLAAWFPCWTWIPLPSRLAAAVHLIHCWHDPITLPFL